MKTAIVGVLSFILGISVAMTACKALRNADRASFRSAVVFPTQSIIADINVTIKLGNRDLADRKLQLLEKKLWEFRDGGESPEIFVSEITKLK